MRRAREAGRNKAVGLPLQKPADVPQQLGEPRPFVQGCCQILRAVVGNVQDARDENTVLPGSCVGISHRRSN
eukprot:4509727-Lingulodinium_polyedra.AAC.1